MGLTPVTRGLATVSEVRSGYKLYVLASVPAADLATYQREAGEVVDDYINTETIARRSAALPSWIGWTLVPPLVLLLLGWAVGWVLSGFRRTA